jgi:hypothetical protein
MLSEIEQFVNWVRRRSPQARTWKDYSSDLQQFIADCQVGLVLELLDETPDNGHVSCACMINLRIGKNADSLMNQTGRAGKTWRGRWILAEKESLKRGLI